MKKKNRIIIEIVVVLVVLIIALSLSIPRFLKAQSTTQLRQIQQTVDDIANHINENKDLFSDIVIKYQSQGIGLLQTSLIETNHPSKIPKFLGPIRAKRT